MLYRQPGLDQTEKLLAEWLLRTKRKMNALIAQMTGQTLDKVEHDVERDYFMSAEEALKYGIIDEIYQPKGAK